MLYIMFKYYFGSVLSFILVFVFSKRLFWFMYFQKMFILKSDQFGPYLQNLSLNFIPNENPLIQIYGYIQEI